MISISEVTLHNVRRVCNLKFSPGQLDYITHNAVSIAESQFIPESKIYSIMNNEVIIGFLMCKITDTLTISRFMIDSEHQRKGYGTLAINVYLQEFKNVNKFVHVVNKPNNPAVGFWQKIGFEITNMIEGHNVILRHSTNS